MAMQAPIHVSESSESVVPRIIAVVAGIAILGAVAFAFVAASGAWSPPATTQSQPNS
ncbi:MAG TPA: hypothetical protein VGT78_12900 [Rhizomicrobium sp.]|nr:hypothetical protein [Rhizomicrobium sp.]